MREDWETARVSYVVLDEADQMLAPMKCWLRSPEDTDAYKQVTKEHSVNVYCVELVLDCQCYARRTSDPLQSSNCARLTRLALARTMCRKTVAAKVVRSELC